MKVGDLVKCRELIRQWSSDYSEYREEVGIVMGIYSLSDEGTLMERINLRVMPDVKHFATGADAIIDVRLPDGSVDTFDVEDCEVISESSTE